MDKNNKRIKSWTTPWKVYLAIGIIWGTVAVYQQNKNLPRRWNTAWYRARTFILNTIFWSVSMPFGIYSMITGESLMNVYEQLVEDKEDV